MLIRKLDPPSEGKPPGPPVPFIVGASRSGTTLLRMMLDAHPDLAIPPETHFVKRLAHQCERARWPTEQFIESIRTSENWADFGIDGGEFSRRVRAIVPFDLGAALRVFYTLYAERFGKARWGDKTPGYVQRMTLIQQLLPEARFVHLIRDGRDVALSVQSLWFGPATLHDASGWWVERITQARAQAASVPAYLEIRYEDLVLEPERTLRDVAAFLDLPWDDVMLAYHERAEQRLAESTSPGRGKRAAAVDDAARRNMHALTAAPPNRQRIGRWEREMDDASLIEFERVAGDLLVELGYARGAADSGS